MTPRERALEAFNRHSGNIRAAAAELGVARSTIFHHVKAAGIKRPEIGGRTKEMTGEVRKLPPKGGKAVYILTCAQNNTKLFEPFWENLQALAEHDKAEILCASFSYNKNAYGELAVKRGTKDAKQVKLWYDPRVEPLMDKSDKRIQLAPDLLWCGEMNIEPTAARPLSGIKAYTGPRSGIFPHAKVAMESVATGQDEPAKFNYTTGTVTQRNYIQKKAGLKAEFHHVYGALLVEVESDGTWFARQLNADNKGRFQDLDRIVEGGKVTTGNHIVGATWGDIHVAKPDKVVYQAIWGKGGIIDQLKPRHQFMHDVLDNATRNKHVMRYSQWHEVYRTWAMGFDSVEKEVEQVAAFLDQARRPFCQTVVANSNHDNFLLHWLEQADYRRDPVNARYFLRAQSFVYDFLYEHPQKQVPILRWAVENVIGAKPDLIFLEEDESFLLFDIENGAHGDLGPNGARGSSAAFAGMGRKMNRGHEHSASIYDGVYTAGLSGNKRQGYNRGPSSWSVSHIFTYQTGKRAIITMRDGRYRAIV